ELPCGSAEIPLLPRLERGEAPRPRARKTRLFENRFDLGRTPGKCPDDFRVDAREVSPGTPQLTPRDAETLGELRSQLGLVEVASRPKLEIQPSAVERRPTTFGALGEVGDQDVAVEVGVRGAAGAVEEAGGDK